MHTDNRTAHLIIALLLVQTLISGMIVFRLSELSGQGFDHLAGLPLLSPDVVEVAIGDSPGKGSPNPMVTIVEFSDFTCGACRQAQSTLESLLLTHSETVRVIYKHFPLRPQGNSMTLALGAECARRQDNFWPMHDAIFESDGISSEGDLLRLVDNLGLNIELFEGCLEAETTRAVVERDLQAGRSLNISGTPTFFINGRRMMGVPALSDLVEAIESFSL